MYFSAKITLITLGASSLEVYNQSTMSENGDFQPVYEKISSVYSSHVSGGGISPLEIENSPTQEIFGNIEASGYGWDDGVYSVSQKKIPPEGRWDLIFHFFTNPCGFLIDFLHTYYTFLSTLDYKFVFNYPRF